MKTISKSIDGSNADMLNKQKLKMNESSESHEFLTFKLGRETFALEAAKVREVLKYEQITEVPRMPVYLPGVISVRGSIIPVMDAIIFLGIKNIEDKKKQWLVITEVILENKPVQIGIQVDAVEDVLRFGKSEIGSPPDIGINIDPAFIQGVGKRDEMFIIIIDIDKIIAAAYAIIQ